MHQKELYGLIKALQGRTIGNADFIRLKSAVSRRVRIRGEVKHDVVMIAIEKICYSRVLFEVHNVNLFVRQRITDAYYKAGIADENKKKIQKSNRVKLAYAPHEHFTEVEDQSWQSPYLKAEARIELERAMSRGRSSEAPLFEAGGCLFPASPSTNG